MKKVLFALVLLLGIFQNLSGKEYSCEDNRYDEGITVLWQNGTGIEYTYTIGNFSLEEIIIEGKRVQQLVCDDDFLPADEGYPDLPCLSRMIAVPENARAEVKISWQKEEIITGVDLVPAHRIPLENEDGLEYFWGKVYEKNVLYPEELLIVSEISEIRGVDYVMVSVHPFRYNPVMKELHFYRDIKITVNFNGGNGIIGEQRLRSRWWDPVLRSNLLNWRSLPGIDYANRTSGHRTPDHEYLIITPTETIFTEWADSIRVFRTQQGIRTGVVTLAETGSSNSQIESYINNAYHSWDIPPVAILFLGDYGTNATNRVNCPNWDNYCISDNIFADITGNDLPDLSTARITARNATELELMVRKFLDYERNPPTSAEFYRHPVVAGGWQTERWFILCTEVVRGFWANELNKDPVREYAIYEGNPENSWSSATNTASVVNYWGTNGLGYLPGSPEVIPNWNANASDINNDINSGCFMLQHRDHGEETGWGEPDYSDSDLSELNNQDLTFVFSTNCLTGKFNWSSESFTEAFHRHAQGALGIIAATEVSYSFVNDAYVWGTYDFMWPGFDPGYGEEGENSILPCFANSSGKWYLESSNWPYNIENKEVTYYLFHHHGDAFSTVFTEIPQEISVEHSDVLLSGVTQFEITAEEGSFICLSVDNEILSATEANGLSQQLFIEAQEPATDIHIVVTKQDHYRYERNISVIPPEGAYAVVREVSVASGDDDIIEYNEEIILGAEIENYGNEDASNLIVSISCEDDYITITDNQETVPFVNAGTSVLLENAFGFSVSFDVPEEHEFIINTNVESDQGSWQSNISLIAYAPVIQLGAISVTGDNNENGRLDPGEEANLNIEIINSGGSELLNVIPELIETNPNCDIIISADPISYIGAGETGIFSWRLEIDQETEIGHLIEFVLEAEADHGYSITNVFSLTVGLILEDFESAGFDSYDWVMTGGGWQTSPNGYEGSFCARSASIDHNQSAGMEIDVNVLTADELSFYYQVSSESGYDYLRFYIDGQETAQWSGSVSWTEFSVPVSTGAHTFGWAYTKDYSVSNGSDCAWIDYIVFPPMNVPQPAQMVLSDEAFDFNLMPQSGSSEELMITNTGGRDLTWALGKNYIISRSSGGPDNYGYQWLDSNEAGGPLFNWIDISQTGTEIDFTNNDAGEGPYPIGFNFNFYGEDYSSFIVNPNGWIGFGDDITEWSNVSLPSSEAPHPAVMGYWDDLYPAIGVNGQGEVYYQNFGDHLIVMFDNVQHYPGNFNGNYTFEMIFYENGEILLQYDNMNGDIDSATIGIQNGEANDALQVISNENYVQNNLTVRIVRVIDWLEVNQTSGIISVSDNDILTLNVDTNELPVGEYLCNLTLSSNDPLQQTTIIPVNLLVGGDIAYGDIDDNEAIEAYDAAIILQYFVGIDPPGVALPWEVWRQIRADVDANDSIEAYDASLILQYSVGLINEFPVEHPLIRKSKIIKPVLDYELKAD